MKKYDLIAVFAEVFVIRITKRQCCCLNKSIDFVDTYFICSSHRLEYGIIDIIHNIKQNSLLVTIEELNDENIISFKIHQIAYFLENV